MAFSAGIAAKGKLATLVWALAASWATTAVAEDARKDAPVIPSAYIVEFSSTATGSQAFYSNLSTSAINASPRLDISHEIFNGVSFKLEGAHDNRTIQTIREMAMVNKIWPVRLYNRPADVNAVAGQDLVTATQKRRTNADTFTPHLMTGVDKLHAEGVFGDGIFVGVVDTGVDYNHPALGGGFGPGYKVVGGYDLVGDAYNGFNTPVPKPDPMDCDGHGTHVSGIIGASSDNPYGFSGVAPNATIAMYKVFGCKGRAANDVLIQAFIMAYQAGVDVISASIGGSNGWTEDPWDVAVQRIAEKGTPSVIAAGNDGATGLFYTSSAGDAIGAIAVGSVDNEDAPGFLVSAQYQYDGGTPNSFGYAMGLDGDFGTVSVPLYAPTLDSAVIGDGCNGFTAPPFDLSTYVVLIRRGNCIFDTKIRSALNIGARRVLFYNNVATTPIAPGDTFSKVPVGMVSDKLGAEWISQLKAGVQVTVDFTTLQSSVISLVSQSNLLTGGKMSTFTSWGPTFEAYIKPQISAPGGFIVSTYPLKLGGYAVLSGTSMATPFISGVLALIKQVRGKNLSPQSLSSILATSGNPVNWNDGTGTQAFLAPVVQQGGGLINAYKAVHSTTSLNLDIIALNDTAYLEPVHRVKITNTGDHAQTYSFDNIIAATPYTLNGGVVPSRFPPALVSTAGASIRFEPESLTIRPKSSGFVTLHFVRPANVDAARIPVYGGYIAINGTNGDSLTLPYSGIASRLKDAKIMDTTDGYPFLVPPMNAPPSPTAIPTYTLPGNNSAYPASDLPIVVIGLAMGCPLIRVDIVPQNAHGLHIVAGQQILSSVPSLPVAHFGRGLAVAVAWDGTLTNGSFAAAGTYKLMSRLLRLTGDPRYDPDYERYDTPYFTIQYAT